MAAVMLFLSCIINGQLVSETMGKKTPYYGLKNQKQFKYTYIPDSTGFSQKLTGIIRMDYNLAGNLTDSTVLDSAGILQNVTSFLYDRNGHQLSAKNYDSAGTLLWRQSFIFNSENRIREKSWFDSTNTIFKSIKYDYNEFGGLKNIITSNLRDSVSEKIVYRSDDRGRLIEKRWYDNDNVLRRKSEFNEEEKLIGTLLYHSDGSQQWKYVFPMDSRTGVVESQVVTSNNTEVQTKFVHDREKKHTEMLQYDSRGELLFRILSEYDEHNNYIQISEFDSDSRQEFRSEFKYDDKQRLESEKYYLYIYTADEQAEVPYELIIYEYEFHPGDSYSD